MVKFVWLLLIPLLLISCTTVQRGAATGAVAGGALGAIIGHQSGHTAEGAGIGAATGAVAGAVIAEQMETKFCPKCGRRFPSSVKYCPYDGTELKPLKEKGN
ncbi:MAG: glycine zipper 2TM domain-containing protein [Candidatus Omnitrophica bacterium]|nr:glycine zipper 2TM domain-containing protein [Candidatus Omnitrophota bacterium]